MRREQAIAILTANQEEIKKFRVKYLSLFGSVARDEAGADSNVDLLVEFETPVGLFTFMRHSAILGSNSRLFGRFRNP